MADNPNKKGDSFQDADLLIFEGVDKHSSKSVHSLLRSLLGEALNIEEQLIQLEHPVDLSRGDFALTNALTNAKVEQTNPRELALKYAHVIENDEGLKNIIEKTEVAGPGFINIFLRKDFLCKYVLRASRDQNFAENDLFSGKSILFEYAHPNPFKAFHIGHLRNIILGESLIRLLENLGATVKRVNYQGDVGMHIAKNLWALRKVNEKDFPEGTDERVKLLGKTYVEGATAFTESEQAKAEITEINKLIYSKEDPSINKLWETGKKWSLDKFAEIYERLYSTFERQYMESETLPYIDTLIDKALDEGILKRSQGAIVFAGEKFGLDTRVFLNSEGLPTYEGKELGLAELKNKDYGIVDLHIHNVAVEQISFFNVTFKVKELLFEKYYAKRQYHNAYAFVGLVSGKMASRTGKVVLAEDVLNEAKDLIANIVKERVELPENEQESIAEIVSVGAVKYAFLNLSPKTYLAFDMSTSISFEGNSGPYLQYTIARANKILSAATDFKEQTVESLAEKLTNLEEVALIRIIYRFEEVLVDSALNLSPNTLCSFLYEMAQRFNQFYKLSPILKEQDNDIQNARLELTRASSNILKKGLYLLGIKYTERM